MFTWRLHALLPVVQSSCTTPYLEAESEQVQNMQDVSQIKCGISNVGRHGDCAKFNGELVIDASETGGTPYVLICLYKFIWTLLRFESN